MYKKANKNLEITNQEYTQQNCMLKKSLNEKKKNACFLLYLVMIKNKFIIKKSILIQYDERTNQQLSLFERQTKLPKNKYIMRQSKKQSLNVKKIFCQAQQKQIIIIILLIRTDIYLLKKLQKLNKYQEEENWTLNQKKEESTYINQKLQKEENCIVDKKTIKDQLIKEFL
ncbi:hypothetical protein TTHERM_000191059 (macronuclear) [Tetrahymena thermophila SB210]|uniref:Uncharacterized protein n=1 Tax=Tetrahymena thermophila (strain SB210) TaxID=312017 RepID=W7XJL4_TETTS|nr:hypothetical protein TTHERM_000191059 [Tetrahymena thermophila SB210]EWS74249.1 hypothetical protein TTHERM_000191059 [Tetrahymena thermophila SB210]|eukprot:XP_012653222.1 hypothetical protein TTHERM_000191059 [Tetrahymena thermophila SB210]